MKFSKTTGCFYPENIAYPNPPTDLIEVLPEDALAAMSRAPGAALDVVAGKLVVITNPQRPLSEAKSEKLAALAADRKRIETLPITGNQGGKTFKISRPEKVQEFLMGGLSIALDPSTAASFTMLDDNGVEVTYSKTLMGQIISFINASKQPALKRYNARKAAIEAARDAAELAAVDTDLTKP